MPGPGEPIDDNLACCLPPARESYTMIKTKFALAAMMMALAFAPAEAARKPQKAKSTKTAPAKKSSKSSKSST
jgi:hypothetical protein